MDSPTAAGRRRSGQDAWIGTGSVVKVDDIHYLFYTGRTGAANAGFKGKIMIAKGSNPYTFEKVDGAGIPAEVRPRFHMTPCVGWTNDPNGFFTRISITCFTSITPTSPMNPP